MNHFVGPLASFCASLTWAFGSSVYGKLAQKYDASTINMNRALLAFPFYLLLALFLSTGSILISAEDLLWVFISMIASFALGDVCFLMATKHIGVPSSLAVASSYPIFSALLGLVVNQESLGALQFFGLLLTVVGVMAVIVASKKENTKGHLVKGVLFALATSVFWALNTYCVARLGHGNHVFIVNLWRMIIAIILCPIVGYFLLGHRPQMFLEKQDYRRYGYVFVAEAVGGSSFYVYGLSHTPLAVGAALSSLAPVISVPVAVLLGQEKFSLRKTIAICIVMSGIYLLLSKGQ